jgi:hypothetical protein
MIQRSDLVRTVKAALTEAQAMHGQGLHSISQEDLMILLDIVAEGIIEALRKTHPEGCQVRAVQPHGER